MTSPTSRAGPTSGRIYYGWWIVVASTLLLTIGTGFYILGFSAFVLPLVDEFEAERGPISLALSISTLEGAILGPLQGYFVDRFGPRRIMLLGVTLMGLGFVLLSTASSMLQFYLYFIPFIGLGTGMGMITPTFAAVNNWFIRKRGIAFGIATSGVGVGALLVILSQFLINSLGWRDAALIIGVICWVVGYPMASLMRHRPEQYGMLPDGIPPPAAGQGGPRQAEETNFSVMDAFKTRAFWLLALGFGLRNLASAGLLLHFIPAMVEKDFSAITGALVLGIMGALTIPGRIGFGALQDRMEKRKVGGVAACLVGIAIIVFVLGDGLWALALFVGLYSLGWGGSSPTQQAIRGDYFGRANYAKINGFSTTFQTAGAIVGPTFAGFTYDSTGSYQIAFLCFAGLSTFSGILVWIARRPVLRSEPGRPVGSLG